MELPDWVWDELKPRTTGAAGLCVALAVFRYGITPPTTTGSASAARVELEASMQSLAGMARISKRALEDAVKELQKAGFLEVKRSERRGQPGVFAMPYEWPERANSAPEPTERSFQRARFAQWPDSLHARAIGAGGDSQEIRLTERGSITTSSIDRTTREQILRVLHGLQVDSVGGLLEQYGIVEVYGALNVLLRKMQVETVDRPAGLLVKLLQTTPIFDAPDSPDFLKHLEEPTELRRQRDVQRWGFRNG